MSVEIIKITNQYHAHASNILKNMLKFTCLDRRLPMCGHFVQSMTREDYLALLAEEGERDIPYDPEPIGRFNLASGTKVLLLSKRDEQLHYDFLRKQSQK